MSEAGDIVDWVVSEVPGLGGRIYPLVLPTTPLLPAATYQLVSEGQDPTQDGPGLAEPRYRFKVWTESYAQLDPVVRQIKAAFNARKDGPFRSSLVDNGGPEDRDVKTGRYWRVVDVLGWQSSVPAVGS